MSFTAGVFVGFVAGAAVWQVLFVRYRNRQIRKLQDQIEVGYQKYVEEIILPSRRDSPEASS